MVSSINQNSLARSGSLNVRLQLTLGETVAIQEDPMTADVLATRVASGIAVITLGSPQADINALNRSFRIASLVSSRRAVTTLEPS